VRAGVLVLALVLVLAGCAVVEPPPGEDSDDAPAEAPERGEEPGESAGVAAVRRLLADAREASDNGDNDRACALLERALRSRPDSAVLWHNLAIVRYRETAYEQAADLAGRSLSHAGDNRELKRRNWEVIAASRQMLGDEDGAARARQRARGLEEAGGE
jgi:tetratricopeptide (TPR) repeat protein